MALIKKTAVENLNAVSKPRNIMLGGNFSDSEFYHSFGQFIHRDFHRFDP